MPNRRETTEQGRTPEALDYLVRTEGRIALQLKPQKTDKITYVAHFVFAAGRRGGHLPAAWVIALAFLTGVAW
jgi:hypothetical protein